MESQMTSESPSRASTNDSATGKFSKGAVSVEPQPTPGGHSITELVLFDLQMRRTFGIKKYGQELLSNDGRDTLFDAYQEALDLCLYLRKVIHDRDGQ